jgi:hypothetical protein
MIKCTICDGEGDGYAFCDRDVIEGYKLAPVHTCLACDGNGYIDKNDWKYEGFVAYVNALKNKEKNEREAREKREADHAKLVNSAKKKLTKDDMDALGIR